MPRWNVNFSTRVSTDSRQVTEYVAKIRALAAVIRGIPIPPGVQRTIDALNIMRAVRATTGIEGTELAEEEVAKIMEAPPEKRVLPPNRRREEQEVRNAELLMYFVASEVSRDPGTRLTEELICKIHEITTRGIDYPNNIPGKYRSHAVSAGAYVPPPSGVEVRKLMREFVRWFNEGAPATWDPIIKAIVGHFYVVSIHPFGDGNGRTARGLESFLLFQAGVNARGFYSLANYYYRLRSDYVQLLDHVRFNTNGDLTPFVLFALRGLAEELEAVHSEVLQEVKLIAFRDFARETLSLRGKLGTKAGERMFHFLLGLGPDPLEIKALRNGRHELSRYYRKVTNKTLSRDINFLKSQRLILVQGDSLRANLAIMTQFVPPAELNRIPPTLRRSRKAVSRETANATAPASPDA